MKLALGCEMSLLLRKFQPSLKFQFKPLNFYFPFHTSHLSCENPPLVRKLSQARAPFPKDLCLKKIPTLTSGHPLSTFSKSAMPKTQGANTLSPSGRHRPPRVVLVQDSMTEPSQPLVFPPSVEGSPPSPSLRRYKTRKPPTTLGASSSRPKKSANRPPKKKARISAPVEPSEPSSEPQPPITESQIPSGMTPEVIIRGPWSLSHP